MRTNIHVLYINEINIKIIHSYQEIYYAEIQNRNLILQKSNVYIGV